jgi:hypothetical protein
MMMKIGQGLFGKIKFVDGNVPVYDRTYLVVDVTSEKVGTLNISSIAGKEHKLLFQNNKEIKNHYPPFLKRSFVKLDSLIYIPIIDAQKMYILSNGQTLDYKELCIILSMLKAML